MHEQLQKREIKYHLVRPKNKKSMASENAGDQKNLHPGAHKFIFVIDFPEIFSSLRYFLLSFLFSWFFACFFVFWNWKYIYSNTHSTVRVGEWWKNFHQADLRKQDYFFFLASYFFVRTALRQIMGQVNFKKLLKLPNFIDIFHCCMTRLREKKEDVSWAYSEELP